MNFTHFQIIDPVILESIAALRKENALIRKQRILMLKNYPEVCEAFFCEDTGHLSHVRLLAGDFDKAIWKRSKHGFLPKVRTPFAKEVLKIGRPTILTKALSHLSIMQKNIISKADGGRMGVYSAGLAGHAAVGHLAAFYYLKVPHHTETFTDPVPEELLQIHKWEALKGVSDLIEAEKLRISKLSSQE